jgi:hypothetical protein
MVDVTSTPKLYTFTDVQECNIRSWVFDNDVLVLEVLVLEVFELVVELGTGSFPLQLKRVKDKNKKRE